MPLGRPLFDASLSHPTVAFCENSTFLHASRYHHALLLVRSCPRCAVPPPRSAPLTACRTQALHANGGDAEAAVLASPPLPSAAGLVPVSREELDAIWRMVDAWKKVPAGHCARRARGGTCVMHAEWLRQHAARGGHPRRPHGAQGRCVPPAPAARRAQGHSPHTRARARPADLLRTEALLRALAMVWVHYVRMPAQRSAAQAGWLWLATHRAHQAEPLWRSQPRRIPATSLMHLHMTAHVALLEGREQFAASVAALRVRVRFA